MNEPPIMLMQRWLNVALQDIGDCIGIIGRVGNAGARLDGIEWGRAIASLLTASRHIHAASLAIKGGAAPHAPIGSKLNPGPDDCWVAALPNEPYFTLLGRDPSAPELVMLWADIRTQAIARGDRPPEDKSKCDRAIKLATTMREWRAQYDGAWKNSQPTGGAAT